MEFYDYEEDDEEEGYYLAELPPISNPLEVYLISQFLIEADRKENLMNSDVIHAMDSLYEKYGQGACVSAMNYVQRTEGWDMEILMEKFEVEDHLMGKYNLYDEDIWLKVLGTGAMSDLRREIYALTRTYLDDAVREVLEREQPNNFPAGDPLL